MDIAYKVVVTGRVTGVGFRYSTVHYASKFSFLRGYVRNIGYGEVEAVFQGKQEEVDQMIDWMRRGPSMARVDEIHINKIPVNPNLGPFNIK